VSIDRLGPVGTLTATRFHQLAAAFSRLHVVVVGDIILDEYLWGVVTRVSPEAPVPVVEEQRRSYAAGGAGNVAVNVAALGARASLIGVVGRDTAATHLVGVLQEAGVVDASLLPLDRPTTLKTRVLSGHHQVCRIDREERAPIGSAAEEALLDALLSRLSVAHGVILSDYNKGLFADGLAERIRDAAHRLGKPVLANPKPANLLRFRGIDLVSVNQSEAEACAGFRLDAGDSLARAGSELRALAQTEAVLVTLGGQGLAIFSAAGSHHLHALRQEVFDVCGAGDSVIAAAALARAAGGDWVEVAAIANLAGNAKVRKRLVVPVSVADLEAVRAASPPPEGATSPPRTARGEGRASLAPNDPA